MVRELPEDDEIQEKGFRSMQFVKRKTLDKQHILAKRYLNTSIQLAWNFWLPPSCPWYPPAPNFSLHPITAIVLLCSAELSRQPNWRIRQKRLLLGTPDGGNNLESRFLL